MAGSGGEQHSMEQPPEPPPQPSQPPGPCSSNGDVLYRIVSAKTRKDSSGEAENSVEGRDGVVPSATAAQTRFTQLLQGLDAPGDSGNAAEPPPWLDGDLFERGRQFYRRYLFCIFISDLLALLAMFSVGRIFRPLLYTRRSDTPARALRRYVSTISHVVQWYTGDLWRPGDPAREDILKVRRIHNSAAATFNSPSHRADVHQVTAGNHRSGKDSEQPPPTCPFHAPVRKDLKGQVEAEGRDGTVMAGLETLPEVYISQWDMAFTQYSFMGVMLAHPWRMGAWGVTDEELEGLVHFWRGCGWLLGVEDRYNFCSGTLEETRALCLEMESQVVLPCLARAGRDTELLGTALVDGVSSLLPWFSYPAMLLFLGDTFGLKLPSVRACMSVRHKIQYIFLRFLIHGLFVVPGVVWVFNNVLKVSLSVVQGHYPKWKPKVVVKPYEYT